MGSPGREHARMRPAAPIKRYSLARPGVGEQRQDEAVRRLRLVRMEQIAARDHARERDRRRVP